MFSACVEKSHAVTAPASTAPLISTAQGRLIAVAVWAGGYRPGILAAIVGYLAVNYFFIEPRGSISLENAGDVGRFIAYVISTGLIIALLAGGHGFAGIARAIEEDATETVTETHTQDRLSPPA